MEAHHVEILEREVSDLRGLSERQAEHIVALEKSLATSKVSLPLNNCATSSTTRGPIFHPPRFFFVKLAGL